MAKTEIIYKLFPFLAWKSLITLRTIRSDLIAGFTGAVIVLPQGVAFAMIAGLPPQYGLYTAIVTPIVAALFGSSRHLISGPTTAISIVVFSAVSHYAEPGSEEFIRLALMLTFLAGVYQLGFGLVRLGALVNFVSPTVITGFTAGAAILIATTQLSHVLGIELARGESFLSTWLVLLQKIEELNLHVFAVAMVTLVSAIVLRKFIKRGPVLLLAMIIGSVFNWAIQGEQHGVVLVGKLTAYLPEFTTHDFSFSSLLLMAPQALAVSLLGLIEAVSISTSLATRSRQQIDVNQEFIGQGLSNIVGSFFSSYAGSGSFTRTGVNFDAGAKTQLSAIFAALFLMIILFFASSLTGYLPVAAMGGIILLVAYNLVEFHQIRMILRVGRTESLVFGITFLATLFLNLEFAIYAGVMLSLFFFLNRSAKPTMISLAPDASQDKRRLYNADWKPLTECPQLKIVQINGSLFFGAIDHVASTLKRFQEEGFRYRHFLIVADGINIIDLAGAEMLARQVEQLRKLGGSLCFIGLKAEAKEILFKEHFKNVLSKECFFDSITTAIAYIVPRLDKEKCQLCFRDVFRECARMKE